MPPNVGWALREVEAEGVVEDADVGGEGGFEVGVFDVVGEVGEVGAAGF